MMTREQVVDGLGMLVRASWPDGVAFKIEAPSDGMSRPTAFRVEITLEDFPGSEPDVFCFAGPMTAERVDRVIGAAESALEFARSGGRVTPPPADMTCPRPVWLRATLARVDAALPSLAGSRALARELVRALEFDSAPVPEVTAYRGEAVVLLWRHDGREVEIGCMGRNHAILSVWSPEGSWIDRVPVGPGADVRLSAYAEVRRAVAAVLDRDGVTRAEMEALCYVRGAA